jgi:hypothetical protein
MLTSRLFAGETLLQSMPTTRTGSPSTAMRTIPRSAKLRSPSSPGTGSIESSCGNRDNGRLCAGWSNLGLCLRRPQRLSATIPATTRFVSSLVRETCSS